MAGGGALMIVVSLYVGLTDTFAVVGNFKDNKIIALVVCIVIFVFGCFTLNSARKCWEKQRAKNTV